MTVGTRRTVITASIPRKKPRRPKPGSSGGGGAAAADDGSGDGGASTSAAVAIPTVEAVPLPPTERGAMLEITPRAPARPTAAERRRAQFMPGGSSGSSGGGDSGAGGSSAFFRKASKTQLTDDEAGEVARRLREPGSDGSSGAGTGSSGSGDGSSTGVIRLYRYAVDDFRLLKALDQARLEGRVIVVNGVEDADIVVAVRAKRTGKQVDVGPARRAAAARGVPFVELPALTARRLVDALAPLLGEGAAAAAMAAALAAAPPRGVFARAAGGVGDDDAPRVITAAEAAADGGDALMQLLYAGAGQEGEEELAAAGAAAAAAAGMANGGSSGGVGDRAITRRAARLADPWAFLAEADAEDDRADVPPRNPTARAAARYPAPARPIRHGERVRRRKLERLLQDPGDHLAGVDDV